MEPFLDAPVLFVRFSEQTSNFLNLTSNFFLNIYVPNNSILFRIFPICSEQFTGVWFFSEQMVFVPNFILFFGTNTIYSEQSIFVPNITYFFRKLCDPFQSIGGRQSSVSDKFRSCRPTSFCHNCLSQYPSALVISVFDC